MKHETAPNPKGKGAVVLLWRGGFKFGFIGGLTVPLPSPAEKGDREAVDEESG